MIKGEARIRPVDGLWLHHKQLPPILIYYSREAVVGLYPEEGV